MRRAGPAAATRPRLLTGHLATPALPGRGQPHCGNLRIIRLAMMEAAITTRAVVLLPVAYLRAEKVAELVVALLPERVDEVHGGVLGILGTAGQCRLERCPHVLLPTV